MVTASPGEIRQEKRFTRQHTAQGRSRFDQGAQSEAGPSPLYWTTERTSPSKTFHSVRCLRRTTRNLLDVATHAPGPAGVAADHGGDAADRALRQSVRPDAECGHGLGADSAARSRVSDSEHAWRPARGGWRGHRAGLSHRALGSGLAGGRGCARVEGAARDAVCRGSAPIRAMGARRARRG